MGFIYNKPNRYVLLLLVNIHFILPQSQGSLVDLIDIMIQKLVSIKQ